VCEKGETMHLVNRPKAETEVRKIAIAVPLKNEASHILPMLSSLDESACRYGGDVTLVVVANDCSDSSIDLLASYLPRHMRLEWCAVSMLPGSRHAGWARRLALDAAADQLRSPRDVLLSTDADTLVSPDWIRKIVAHIDLGYNAVAGQALTRREERQALGAEAKKRLDHIGRYYTALSYLQMAANPVTDDPWPRHFYEGGASIALTLELYRRIGGAPTPPVAEDKALFDRIREHGGRIRHPVDVRVFTSCRTVGRAPGGMADTLTLWIEQTEDGPLHELYNVSSSLSGQVSAVDQLCFRTLPSAQAEAQRRINVLRDGSEPLPQIEPVLVMPLRVNFEDRSPQLVPQCADRFVGGERIVCLTRPMDEHEVAA
jgi:hypothetical protein